MADIRFIGYEDLSVSTTAVGFTASTSLNADYVMVLVSGAPVRFRLDGTAPTASVGDTLEQTDRIELFGTTAEISRAKFISRDGGTATLRCHYGVRGGN